MSEREESNDYKIVNSKVSDICKKVRTEEESNSYGTKWESNYGVEYTNGEGENRCFDLHELIQVPSQYKETDPVYCCTDDGQLDAKKFRNAVKIFSEKSDENQKYSETYLTGFLEKGQECEILKQEKFHFLLDSFTKLLKLLYRVRYYLGLKGEEVNKYDQYIITSVSQMDIQNIDELECVTPQYLSKYPYNLKEYIEFMREFMQIAKNYEVDKSGDQKNTNILNYTSSIYLESLHDKDKDKEEFLLDFQPWMRKLASFVNKYSTDEGQIPIASNNRDKSFLKFIGDNEWNSENDIKIFMELEEKYLNDKDNISGSDLVEFQKEILKSLGITTFGGRILKFNKLISKSTKKSNKIITKNRKNKSKKKRKQLGRKTNRKTNRKKRKINKSKSKSKHKYNRKMNSKTTSR